MSYKKKTKSKKNTNIVLSNEKLNEILYLSFQYLRLSKVRLEFIRESEVFTSNSMILFRDYYANTVLHYIISSPFTSGTKIDIIETYFTPPDLLHTNNDGISVLDLSVIQCDAALIKFVLSRTVTIMEKDQLLKSFKILLLFDHFSKFDNYTNLIEIFSIYYFKYQSNLRSLVELVNKSLDADTESLTALSYLLLDGKKCTEVAYALGSCYLKTDNKRDFLHFCIFTILNTRIPQISECMRDYIPGSQCVKTIEILRDAYLTGRGPRSPVRTKLSFYCNWYLTTLCILLTKGLFPNSEILVLQSLFSFIYILSLWFVCYSKCLIKDLADVKLSFSNFVERTNTICTTIGYTMIPFKRYFTPINIFCHIKQRLQGSLDIDIDMKFIQFLIDCGFSVTERDMFGSFPLHTIIKSNQYIQTKRQFIECLIRHGAYPLSVDCLSKLNAVELACGIDREILLSCYSKPFPLKSIVAQHLSSKDIELLPLPPELCKFLLRHTADVPFYRLIDFSMNILTFDFNGKTCEISISCDYFNY